jgi:biopolymer transport protein ExbD
MKHLLAVCSFALSFVIGTAAFAARQSEPMQRGISVVLVFARNAAPAPDADDADALIVTVTDGGSFYFGIDPINADALAERIRAQQSNRGHRLYVKADAHAQYASVIKVLEAARMAGVEAPILLTARPEWSKPGTLVPPQGLEVLIDPSSSPGADSTVVQVLSTDERHAAVKINDRQIHLRRLRSDLSKILQSRNANNVLLKADEAVPFAQMVRAIDACRAAGATVVLDIGNR